MRNVVAQTTGWYMFGNEAMTAMADCRWLIALCGVLLAGDFWWGCRECRIKYLRAVKTGDVVGMEEHKFRFSRAGRRTANKFVDFLTYFLIGLVLGMAIMEPHGFMTHTESAALGIGLGCTFDLSSIVGHVCYCHGVEFSWRAIWRFIVKVFVNLIKHKSRDLGEALDETIKEDIYNEDEGK